MKLTTFAVAALAAPFVQAAPTEVREIVNRQTKPRELSMIHPSWLKCSFANNRQSNLSSTPSYNGIQDML
jgi:hypothetical protein